MVDKDRNRESQIIEVVMPQQKADCNQENGYVMWNTLSRWLPLAISILAAFGAFMYARGIFASELESQERRLSKIEMNISDVIRVVNKQGEQDRRLIRVETDIETLKNKMSEIQRVSDRNNTILEILGKVTLGPIFPKKGQEERQ